MSKYSCYISSILLGVFMKIYDDFTDLKITEYPLLIDISKIVIIITTYFLIDESYILGIIVFISLIVSYRCKGVDNTFWESYMYFAGFLCIAYFNKIGSLFDYSKKFRLLFLFFLPVGIYFESTIITEEKSTIKTISRILLILICTCSIFYMEYFDFVKDDGIEFVIYLVVFCNFYFLTNIIIHYFHTKYYEKLDEKIEEPKIEEPKIEEPKNEEPKNEEPKNEETPAKL
jgi:hypothetical protein